MLEETKYETVLDAVHQWPVDRQFALVQDILKAVALEIAPSPTKSPTLSRALGLLATDRSTPSDQEIEKWLEENRMEKYG